MALRCVEIRHHRFEGAGIKTGWINHPSGERFPRGQHEKMIPVLYYFYVHHRADSAFKGAGRSLIEVKRLKDLMENTATPVDEPGRKRTKPLKKSRSKKGNLKKPLPVLKKRFCRILIKKSPAGFLPAKKTRFYSAILCWKTKLLPFWIKAKTSRQRLNASGKGFIF